MCGIVGYIGARDVSGILLDGLRRLEYRGYDSCGVAILEEGTPTVIRSVGRIGSLEEKVRQHNTGNSSLRYGIGHTRWATHGRPSEDNSHPHRDCSGRFFVAHNGIIENYVSIKRRLIAEGHKFLSATDTEVLPHLIESLYDGDLEEAVRKALREVEGVYGIVAVSTVDGQKIVAARNGPPLVVGIGDGENFIASDVPALLPYTRDMLFLKDGELAVIDRGGVRITDHRGVSTPRAAERILWTADMAEKEGYAHFMLKEINEQPRAVRDTLLGRLDGNNIVSMDAELESLALGNIDRLQIVAMGTSLHAALAGKFMIESLARLPVEVDNAAEYRYRDPLVGDRTLVAGISQSGETADTLAAMKEAKDKGALLLSICNVVGSQAARQSDAVIYTHAGPEIGVASTKAFTTQLTALYLLGLQLAKVRGTMSEQDLAEHGRRLRDLPDQITGLLDHTSNNIGALAEKFCNYRNFLYLGRGIHHPIAMEGALKLKEISYIHAEGYSAGEMKHGPIALIDREMPVVVLVPQDNVYRKTMGNIEEVKVRDGIVIAVGTEGDTEIGEKADHVIYIPAAGALINAILSTIPLQLLSYHVAVLRGCDVDKPRNLAKSVTVE